MAIVHDYFFNRGVSGSAITIPSASEPVYHVLLTQFLINLQKEKRGLNPYQIITITQLH